MLLSTSLPDEERPRPTILSWLSCTKSTTRYNTYITPLDFCFFVYMIVFFLFQTETRLAILAFPCNQFGAQEPGTNTEVKKFAEGYGVQFDMFEKIDVNGGKAHPLWVYLKEKQGGLFGAGIKWNFTKFVIDRNGHPVARLGPMDDPIPKVEAEIKKCL